MCRGRFVLVFESESTLNKSVMCAKCEREVFNNTAADDAKGDDEYHSALK